MSFGGPLILVQLHSLLGLDEFIPALLSIFSCLPLCCGVLSVIGEFDAPIPQPVGQELARGGLRQAVRKLPLRRDQSEISIDVCQALLEDQDLQASSFINKVSGKSFSMI